MTQLTVDIVATDRQIWSGTATSVSVPAINGELGVLPGRQPLLSLLDSGTVRIVQQDGTHLSGHIDGGFVTVDGDVVTVVADSGSDLSTP